MGKDTFALVRKNQYDLAKETGRRRQREENEQQCEQGKNGASLRNDSCRYTMCEYVTGNWDRLSIQFQRILIARLKKNWHYLSHHKKTAIGFTPRNSIIRSNLRKINLAAVLRLMSLPGVNQIAENLPFFPSIVQAARKGSLMENETERRVDIVETKL